MKHCQLLLNCPSSNFNNASDPALFNAIILTTLTNY